MRRFYLSTSPKPDTTVTITGSEAHHISQVLRLKPGTKIEFFSCDGRVCSGVLTSTSKTNVTAFIEEVVSSPPASSPYPLTLAQAILKGKKMDLIIQKATELGVRQVVPVITRFCEKKVFSEKTLERWQRIMLEACKQSNRSTLMHISPALSLESLDLSHYKHRVVAWENEQTLLQPDFLRNDEGEVCLFIGPEGGWHLEEIDYLKTNNCISFSLGTHVLRSETASISGIAIMKYLIGLS